MLNSTPFRFALFSDDYIGHLNPLIGIAQRLLGANHSVDVFGPGALASQVSRHGISYYSMPCLLPRVYSRENMETVALCPREAGENAVARRTREILDAARHIRIHYRPDVAIFDSFMLCLLPAFAVTGMQCVAVSIAPLLTPDAGVPPYTSGIVPAADGSNRPAIAEAWRKQEAAFEQYLEYSRDHERRHGWSNESLLQALSSVTGFPLAAERVRRHVPHDLNFRSVPEVVVHAKEFEFPRSAPVEALGAYLGPCTIRSPESRIRIAGSGPLIYCQLGTVESQQDDAARLSYLKIMQVIGSENWRAIVVVSSQTMLSELQERAQSLGSRVMFTQWIDQSSALLQADVIVSNAGGSSVKEAILAGTPILAMPRHFDQHGVAARIAFHGLGIVAHPSESEQALQAKITALLTDPAYRQRIGLMQRRVLEYDEAAVCERVFESIAKGRAPRFSEAVLGTDPQRP